MKFVIFGLTISSSWGNGHATLWRGLCRALGRRGHHVVFFERDTPYYALNRDDLAIDGLELVIYPDWETVRERAKAEIRDADVAMTTSYCIDAVPATEMMMEYGRPVTVFYDLDTPVTLSRLQSEGSVFYLGPRKLRGFDLVLSFTGGGALDALRQLGARLAVPLYGHVDPEVHRPVAGAAHYRADLSYLGTYSPDRQEALQDLLVEPARARPDKRFVIGGAQYPQQFPWQPNIFFVRHMPPVEHPAFFSSSRLTLNVTRRPMAQMGWCPSGRLFEAAACGTAMLSDVWEGFEAFFTPGEEILPVRTADDVVAALDLDDTEIARLGAAGRERALAEHTSDRRCTELIAAVEAARAPLREAVGA